MYGLSEGFNRGGRGERRERFTAKTRRTPGRSFNRGRRSEVLPVLTASNRTATGLKLMKQMQEVMSVT
jgi:hypothetical protein